MKLATMRIIDEVVGTFLSALLGVLVTLSRSIFGPTGKTAPVEVKTIVCQKYLGMGSILNALPLIRALRYHYPNAKIIFMTLPSNREVVELCSAGDEVLTLDTGSFGSFVKDIFRCLMALSGRKVDICVDLEFYSKFTLLMSLLMRADIRIGLHMKKIRPRGILTDVVYYNSYKHLSDIYFAYATVLGIAARPEFFTSLLPSMGSEAVSKVHRKMGIGMNRPVVVINVNSGDLFLFRRWPAEHFAILIRLLLNGYPDFDYVLIGHNSDSDYVDNICRLVGDNHNGRLVNGSGLTSIPELFALIESSFMMITNDSGPMHIASLYGRNLVAFFGPESPIVYGPLNSNSLVFYSGKHYCSPCMSVYDSKKCLYGEECRENICLGSIQPESVYAAIEQRFLAPLPDSSGVE